MTQKAEFLRHRGLRNRHKVLADVNDKYPDQHTDEHRQMSVVYY